jgi:hypothetical protein
VNPEILAQLRRLLESQADLTASCADVLENIGHRASVRRLTSRTLNSLAAQLREFADDLPGQEEAATRVQ